VRPTEITLIVCAAPLTARTPELVSHLLNAGWRPSVVSTPAALGWFDGDAVERLTGQPARTTFRAPIEPNKDVEAAAVVVCPATFNTINRAATGCADNFALARICEAVGTMLPTIMVPMINDKLWRHPALAPNLAVFESVGAVLLDVQTGKAGTSPVASGTGDHVVSAFEPEWISAALATLP
jgi:phosphopantothenoylcysteine synthetase/decarboxylase